MFIDSSKAAHKTQQFYRYFFLLSYNEAQKHIRSCRSFQNGIHITALFSYTLAHIEVWSNEKGKRENKKKNNEEKGN